MPPPSPNRRQGKTPDRHYRAGDELYFPAKARAEREGRSLSWVIRHALRLYLDGKLPLDSEGPAPEVGEGAGPGLEAELT